MNNYKFDNINANWSDLKNNILRFVDPSKEIHILEISLLSRVFSLPIF